ncbi:LemA protein [Anaerovirgula multivorans]|uniref:LemA protein n=1 Tax=Anaerovirgula multivorans TaxID=312168 RepID=A0A239BME5_9FIRM|nr:LemA family protein [Anaerovirgula multivorans]SNS09140.1 LemA protein [Anaerovirgula multivorans]
MKTSMKVLIGIGIAILLLIGSIVGSYNGLVTKSETVETALSQIDNQLQRRNDLIPNLVETVKRYAAHEEEIFTNLAEARAKLAGAGTIAQQAEADAAINSALSRLLAIAENYPDLKANENFIQLQDELAGTENRIATARRDYNEASRTYNTSVRRFPTNIFANIFGFERVDYFEASDEARNTPDVGDLFGN